MIVNAYNPNRIDPTRTLSLRRAMLADIRRRFKRVRRKVLDLIVEEDALGLAANVLNCGGEGGKPGPCPEGASLSELHESHEHHSYEDIKRRVQEHFASRRSAEVKQSLKEFGISTPPKSKAHAVEIVYAKIADRKASAERTAEIGAKPLRASDTRLPFDLRVPERIKQRDPRTLNAVAPRWQFMATPEQLKAFQAWLRSLFASEVLGRDENELWRRYAEEGFKKGVGRSWSDRRQNELRKERPELFADDKQDELRDFYEGSKEEFLKSSFARPVGVEKIKVLAARTFTDLKGVTDDMIPKLSRVLLDGLVQGKHSRRIGAELADKLDIGLSRAETIARTEISRAYVEGQLDALERLGAKELGVEVEWLTAGDAQVCPICVELEGTVFSIDDARGVFPAHPNCRCALVEIPVGVTNRRTLSGLTVNCIRVSRARLLEIVNDIKAGHSRNGCCGRRS